MKKLAYVFAVVLCLGLSTVCLAEELQKDDLISSIKRYETNVVGLICGDSWEIPMKDSEFEPDSPLGEYIQKEPDEQVQSKYDTFVSLSSEVGLLDSEVTADDVDAVRLTPFELLKLSGVEFKYYYDYDKSCVIQWYTISWVDGRISRGYVLWDNSCLVLDIKMH